MGWPVRVAYAYHVGGMALRRIWVCKKTMEYFGVV